jgi:hypothetical protein
MTTHDRVFLLIAAMVLTGCGSYGSYYYANPGTPSADFYADSIACTREFGTALPDQQRAVVEPETYQGCMTTRGWVRERRADPAGPGWFRGVDDGEPVGLVQAPAQPVETSGDARMLECWRRHLVGRKHSIDHVTAYNKCMQR